MKKILTLLLTVTLTLTAVAETLDQLRQRAQSGDPEAQYLYAEALRKGGYENDSIPKDIAESLNWYRKAAEQGYVNAQFNLGSHYQSGDGITQNLSLAMYWYLKAAEQGDESALREYNQLYEAGYRPSPEP